jgi:Flp pilus assembly pilin Flp
MNNLVSKFSAEAVESSDEGVVAIEYVIVAAALAAVLLGVFTGMAGALTTKLNSVVSGI